MIAALILAAGESKRMGYPKALLRYRGRSFLESVLEAAKAGGVDRQIVVLGAHSDKILSSIALSHHTVVRTERQAAGPIGSIRAGIRAVINHPVEAVLVWPVDHPHVAVATVQALVAGYHGGSRSIVIPTFERRRGHPVLFSRGLFHELLNAPDDQGARAVVRADPERVFEVAVADRAVIEDIDTREAYQDLLRRSAFPPS